MPRRYLVTGGTGFIGAALVKRLVTANHFVRVLDNNSRGAPRRLGSTVRDVELIEGDIRNPDCVRSAARGMDVVVHLAYVNGTEFFYSKPELVLDIAVRGMLNVTKAYLPEMVARHKGVIVNMASVAGLVGIQDRLAYATTKFAVVGLTKCMALDHAADGVRINCICPGRVETPWVSARVREYPDPEKAYREMAATQAMGRMGKPEEIAAAALYLASDEASFVTGSAFAIDGGWKG